MKANYLICYDIANDRRLARVYRFMKQNGMTTILREVRQA